MTEYDVKYAKIDGSGYDILGKVKTPEEWYNRQKTLYLAAEKYASGVEANFEKMLDLQYEFLQEAEAALDK